MRSENGQLLMIPQQALAQMQAQAHAQSQPQNTMTPRPATPTSAPPVQIKSHLLYRNVVIFITEISMLAVFKWIFPID